MSPVIDLGSLRKSALVNRVRNVYRNNATDSALETLRMESVNISNIRNLSTGLRSSSSDSSEESFQRINFAHRKRFHERVLQRSRSRSNESVKLDRNNTFSEQEKRKNYGEESGRSSTEDFESPLESDYKTPNRPSEDCSPLKFLLNYRQSSDKSEEYNDAQSVNSYRSLLSDEMNVEKSPEKIVKSEPMEGPGPNESFGDRCVDLFPKNIKGNYEVYKKVPDTDVDESKKGGLKGVATKDGKVDITNGKVTVSNLGHTKSVKRDASPYNKSVHYEEDLASKTVHKGDCDGDAHTLSYSFDNSYYVFRIVFEPKLSTVKDRNVIPSRVIVNKTPFVIGSDPTCDLVLSRKKFKFIAAKHCKITYQHYTNSDATDESDADGGEISPSKSKSPASRVRSPMGSNLKKVIVKTEETPREHAWNYGDDETILSYRVKIGKGSPSGIIYVNNSLLRGNVYLENGDIVSLGSRNNNIAFRIVFQTKKECQMLKRQLSTPGAISIDTQSERYVSLDGSLMDTEVEECMSEKRSMNDERIVLSEDINIMGVKIFVFQVFNYKVDHNLDEEEDKEEEGYDIGDYVGKKEGYVELGGVDDNYGRSDIGHCDNDNEGNLGYDDNYSNYKYGNDNDQIHNEDNKGIDDQYVEARIIKDYNREVDESNEVKEENEYEEEGDNDDNDYYMSQDQKSDHNESQDLFSVDKVSENISDNQSYSQDKMDSEYGSQEGLERINLSQPGDGEDYYKLKSPMRKYNVFKASSVRNGNNHRNASSINNHRNKNSGQNSRLDSFKADALLEVYSSSERASVNINNYSMTQESNYSTGQYDSQSSVMDSQGNLTDSQSNMMGGQGNTYGSQYSVSFSQNSANLNEEEYMDKVKFLKSIIPTNFPIAIDTNNGASGSTTPRSGTTHYKLIGTVDACNNMNISEILPSIDELVRTNIDEGLVNFQVVLKNFNTPVEREMLENSWVFQLEFLDVDSPKIKRAIFKHEMFTENQEELENILKNNKCRVMYIKTD